MQVSDKAILEKADLSAEITRKPYGTVYEYEKVEDVIFPTEHSRLESQKDQESPKQRRSGCSSEELNFRNYEGQGQKRIQMFGDQLCLLSVCWDQFAHSPFLKSVVLVKTSPVSPVTEPKLWLCGAQEL